jgi:hypothetical protein
MTHPLVVLFNRAKKAKGAKFATNAVRRLYVARYEMDEPEVEKYQWDESKHPRGQPENAGEFAEVHATVGDRPGEGIHMKLRHGSTITGPAHNLDELDDKDFVATVERAIAEGREVPPQVMSDYRVEKELAAHKQPGDSAENFSSFGSDVKLAEGEPQKQFWQQNLREAIPESEMENSELFKQHRNAVIEAVKAGENVPEDVIADYPDIERQLRERMTPQSTPRSSEQLSQVESSLRDGAVWSKQKFEGVSANQVYSIAIDGGGKGIFKPKKGERPGLREDIPDGEYGIREVAAYEVAKIIGLTDLVPVTTAKTIPGKEEYKIDDPTGGPFHGETVPAAPDEEGSCQEFVEDAETAHAIGGAKAFDGKKDAARAIVFDFIMGNSDRHMGNWMIDASGKIKLIDNGCILPEKHSLQAKVYMGRRQNKLADRYANLPLDEAKAAWSSDETMETIYKTLSVIGVSKQALQKMDERRDVILSATTFDEAIKALNELPE